MKNITVLDCENVKIVKARSHIHRFLLILVSCQYNVVYIAPYHKLLKETALIVYDIVCRCILSPENICF